MDRVAPPREHDHHRWHWIDTEHGMMCASWYPVAVDGGLWDISGQTRTPEDPKVRREWKYVGPAIPPADYP